MIRNRSAELRRHLLVAVVVWLAVAIIGAVSAAPNGGGGGGGVPDDAGKAARSAVPDAAAQAKAERTIRDVFGNYAAGTTDARAASAAKMVEQAASSTDDAAARYVLLRDGADLAASAGDARGAFNAAEELARAFAVDADELRLRLFRKCASAAASAPAAARSAVDAALASASDAAARGDYAYAVKLLPLADAAARDAQAPQLRSSIQALLTDLRAIQADATRAAAAESRLASDPTDAEANLIAGRFLCCAKDDWPAGLARLSRSANPAFRAVAAADLGDPAEYDKRVALGDQWWTLADTENGYAQRALRRRAARWYALALNDARLTGLNRARVEKRVASVPKDAGGATIAAAGANASRRNVVILAPHERIESIFKQVSGGGDIRVIGKSESPDAMADGSAFENANIAVITVNLIRETPEARLTDAVRDNLRRFVERGGDLVIFEQWDATHTAIFEKAFGIKFISGTHNGATIDRPDLIPFVRGAGVTDAMLSKVTFYNGLTLPKGGVSLVRGFGGKLTTCGALRIGSGRVIAIATNLSDEDVPLDEAILDYIYRYKRAAAAAAKSDLGRPSDVTGGSWISRNATYTIGPEQHLHFAPLPSFLTCEGKTYANDSRDGFSINVTGETPWATIDLGRTYRVTRLEIVNRKGGYDADRARTLTAWVGPQADGPWTEVWSADGAQPQWTAVVEPPVSGRYVKLGLKENVQLHLFSAKVFGLPG